MDTQFILKSPPELKQYLNSAQIKLSPNGIKFIINNKIYKSSIIKLPTILESYKMVETDKKANNDEETANKTILSKPILKSNVINYAVVIWPFVDSELENKKSDTKNSTPDINTESILLNSNLSKKKIEEYIKNETETLEVSGITPPLKYCKLRRLQKQKTKAEKIIEAEEIVKNLILKEKRCEKVSYKVKEDAFGSDCTESSDYGEKNNNEKNESSDDFVKEIEDLIFEPSNTPQIKIDINPNCAKSENNDFSSASPKIENNKKLEAFKLKLGELEKKILEKKNLVEKAPNFILKKRFQTGLDELMKEKEKLEKEMM